MPIQVNIYGLQQEPLPERQNLELAILILQGWGKSCSCAYYWIFVGLRFHTQISCTANVYSFGQASSTLANTLIAQSQHHVCRWKTVIACYSCPLRMRIWTAAKHYEFVCHCPFKNDRESPYLTSRNADAVSSNLLRIFSAINKTPVCGSVEPAKRTPLLLSLSFFFFCSLSLFLSRFLLEVAGCQEHWALLADAIQDAWSHQPEAGVR